MRNYSTWFSSVQLQGPTNTAATQLSLYNFFGTAFNRLNRRCGSEAGPSGSKRYFYRYSQIPAMRTNYDMMHNAGITKEQLSRDVLAKQGRTEVGFATNFAMQV